MELPPSLQREPGLSAKEEADSSSNESSPLQVVTEVLRGIEFSNIADGLDCADIYTAYLNLFNRIKQIYQQIEWQEQEHNKKFKAAVIWTV